MIDAIVLDSSTNVLEVGQEWLELGNIFAWLQGLLLTNYGMMCLA